MSEDSASIPEQPPQSGPADFSSDSQNQQQQGQLQQQQQQFFSVPGMPEKPNSNLKSPNTDFFSDYRPPSHSYDEILDPDLNLRQHWNSFANEVTRLGRPELDRRVNQIRKIVHQNGIAYSAYGDPSLREKHLQLDPLPHLMLEAEWDFIQRALTQRANLFNRMLSDIFGPQKLLKQNIIPAEVLFQHPQYQLPYHGLPEPGGQHLHFYAAEIVRSPDGRWHVKSDRTDFPGGSAFALENRIATSRAFPSIFRRSNVQRIAPYFIALRDNLKRLAQHINPEPHIAILSAGAGRNGYFEDSMLARYLGFTLVETRDLVVRQQKLMLKTLDGLMPVDVVFRRYQSNPLDPLEIGGTVPGIPGILQAIRSGNVVVANSPGSGLVESPVFATFLPKICESLLGEKLAIESVNSWWGGNAKSLAIMLDRIDEIQLMPAFRVRSGFGQLADKASVDQLALKQLNTEIMTRAKRIELLRTSPSHWVGFEKFPHSSKAYWEDGKTKPGYISIRTFATATDNSWSMLPGGLVRISETPCEIPDNPFSDGRASDAWIISDQPVRPTSLLKGTSDSIQLVRGREFLPSRIAESLFWLGRYLDRADYTSRLLRAVGTRLTGESNPADMLELPSLLRTLIKSGQLNPGFENLTDDDQVKKLEESLPRHALNSSRLNSIHFQIDQIVSLAGQIRDRLSSDAWRMVQDMSATMDDACPSQCEVSDLLDIIDSLIVGLAAYSGFLNDSMTRTKAHKFVNMGNQLEHALQIVSYVKTCVRGISRDTTSILDTMLEISDSSLTYRSRYYTNVQLPAVLDLLLLDPANPRSLIYQLKRLVTNLEQVAQTEGDSKELILAREIAESIQTMDVFQFSDLAQSSQKNDLFKLFESIEQKLPKLATLISNRHFVHTGNFVQIVEDNL